MPDVVVRKGHDCLDITYPDIGKVLVYPAEVPDDEGATTEIHFATGKGEHYSWSSEHEDLVFTVPAAEPVKETLPWWVTSALAIRALWFAKDSVATYKGMPDHSGKHYMDP